MKTKHVFLLSVIILVTVSSFSQDHRYKQFGPLFDAKETSHNELINQGWVYLFDSRIPDENQAVKWSSLELWRPRRADGNNCCLDCFG